MTRLIAFSHLRWDFVYQRPQHLLSRLARTYPVVFIEEPVRDDVPRLERLHPAPGVEILRPHLPGAAMGFHDDHLPGLRSLLMEYLRTEQPEPYWLWLYTPMALPLAAEFDPIGIVYDCMDELSAFLKAPRQLLQRENALLKTADVVFTGGTSLYQAKRLRHPNVYCFPSSVDAVHFSGSASDPGEHPAQADVPHPRLGFYGVIDERLNLDLVAAIADRRPDWQIVMVGPVVKIDPSTLPRRPNIQWLGQRSYEELPALVAGWDVCLLPFALNQATRYISPTKTLEYLAADRPVVSTPIKDVVDCFGSVVGIASTPLEFVARCEAVLAMDEAARAKAARARAAVVASTSWDKTAASMLALLEAARFNQQQDAQPPGTELLPAPLLADAGAKVDTRMVVPLDR